MADLTQTAEIGTGPVRQKADGTYDAAHPEFGSTSDSDETRIQNAINQAAADAGVDKVFVPDSLLPYDASSVTFDNSVRMVREGGPTVAYDARAFGAGGAGDDHAAIQNAIDKAANKVRDEGEIETFEAIVTLPGKGPYEVNSALTLRRGVRLVGTDQSTTVLLHTATDGTNIIESETGVDAVHSGVSDMTVVGNGPTNTGSGIKLQNDFFDGRVERVSVVDCALGFDLVNCWTLRLQSVHAYNNNQNLDWQNATAAHIVSSRFDAATNVGAHIRDASGTNTKGVAIQSSAFQRSGQQGLIIDSPNAYVGGGCFFENNNQDNGSHPYLETRGTGGNIKIGLTYFTEGNGFVGPAMKFDGPENVHLSSPRVASSTNFDNAVTGTAALDILVVTGGLLFATGNKFNLDASTSLVPLGVKGVNPLRATESEEVGIHTDPVTGAVLTVQRDGTLGRVLFDGNNNSHIDVNAPGNRQNNIRFQSGGTTRGVIGRGDSDGAIGTDERIYIHGSENPGSPTLSIDTLNHHVMMEQLPTSDPTIAGALWNDAGTLKVSSG